MVDANAGRARKYQQLDVPPSPGGLTSLPTDFGSENLEPVPPPRPIHGKPSSIMGGIQISVDAEHAAPPRPPKPGARSFADSNAEDGGEEYGSIAVTAAPSRPPKSSAYITGTGSASVVGPPPPLRHLKRPSAQLLSSVVLHRRPMQPRTGTHTHEDDLYYSDEDLLTERSNDGPGSDGRLIRLNMEQNW